MRDFVQIFGTRDELCRTSDRMIGSKYNIPDSNYKTGHKIYSMNKYLVREIKCHTHGIKYLSQLIKYLAQEIKYLAQEIVYLAVDIIATLQRK